MSAAHRVPADEELVTVIVPLYDSAAFLPDCLDGILGQTHRHLEVLAVDDGSRDDSAAIAESYGAVRVVRRGHEGVSAARNAGLVLGTASLVAFCDADDRWHPTKLERQVAHLADRPGTAAVLCRCDIHVEPGVDVPAWLPPDLVYGDPGGIQPLSGLFRRSLLDELEGFHGNDGAEDLDLLFRARASGAVIDVIPEALAIRRVHQCNALRRFGSSEPGMLHRVRAHLRRAPDEASA